MDCSDHSSLATWGCSSLFKRQVVSLQMWSSGLQFWNAFRHYAKSASSTHLREAWVPSTSHQITSSLYHLPHHCLHKVPRWAVGEVAPSIQDGGGALCLRIHYSPEHAVSFDGAFYAQHCHARPKLIFWICSSIPLAAAQKSHCFSRKWKAWRPMSARDSIYCSLGAKHYLNCWHLLHYCSWLMSSTAVKIVVKRFAIIVMAHPSRPGPW